jgi:soluble lytic murein transglycosylase-like protein
MSNQVIEAPQGAAYMVQPPAKWTLSNAGNRNLLTAIHYVITIVGIAALTVLGAMFINPDFADRIIAMSPFAAETQAAPEEPLAVPPLGNLMDVPAQNVAVLTAAAPAAPLTAEERQMIGTARQQKLVTNWISKRYRVAGDATDMLVSAAYVTAKEIKLDPLLILAVMAIESRFNPFAESPVGAQGLMQVMAKVHHDKFDDLGGVKAALNPVANIRVGSLILKEYVTRGGSVEAGLKSYVGAAGFASDGGYGAKVLSEYSRLKEVAYGKHVSYYTTTASAKPTASKPVAAVAAASAEIASEEHEKPSAAEKMVSL